MHAWILCGYIGAGCHSTVRRSELVRAGPWVGTYVDDQIITDRECGSLIGALLQGTGVRSCRRHSGEF